MVSHLKKIRPGRSITGSFFFLQQNYGDKLITSLSTSLGNNLDVEHLVQGFFRADAVSWTPSWGFSEGCTSSHVLAVRETTQFWSQKGSQSFFSLSRESSFRWLLGPVRQPGGSSYCGVSRSPPWTMPLCKETLTGRWPHLAAGSNFSLSPVINGFAFSQTCQLFEAIACCARVGCGRGNASFVSMVTTLREVSPSLQTANY